MPSSNARKTTPKFLPLDLSRKLSRNSLCWSRTWLCLPKRFAQVESAELRTAFSSSTSRPSAVPSWKSSSSREEFNTGWPSIFSEKFSALCDEMLILIFLSGESKTRFSVSDLGATGPFTQPDNSSEQPISPVKGVIFFQKENSL